MKKNRKPLSRSQPLKRTAWKKWKGRSIRILPHSKRDARAARALEKAINRMPEHEFLAYLGMALAESPMLLLPPERQPLSPLQALRLSPAPRRSKGIRRLGARAKREAGELARFRKALRERSNVCEVCGSAPTPVNPLDPHHVAGKGRAVGWPSLNDPELNGLRACRIPCHDRLTRDPKALEHPVSPFARFKINRAFAAFEEWRAGR